MAVWTTSAALPLIVVGGAGGGSSGGAPYSPRPRPPAPPPPPPPAHARRRPNLGDVAAIAVLRAAEMDLQPAAADLGPERDGEHEEQREPPGLSQPRQRRGAPPTCVGPCDGTRGAGPGA